MQHKDPSRAYTEGKKKAGGAQLTSPRTLERFHKMAAPAHALSPASPGWGGAEERTRPRRGACVPPGRKMSAQGDCEFLVKRARELVPGDLWAAKAWLITARSLYPADFNIQVSVSAPAVYESAARRSPTRPCGGRCVTDGHGGQWTGGAGARRFRQLPDRSAPLSDRSCSKVLELLFSRWLSK